METYILLKLLIPKRMIPCNSLKVTELVTLRAIYAKTKALQQK